MLIKLYTRAKYLTFINLIAEKQLKCIYGELLSCIFANAIAPLNDNWQALSMSDDAMITEFVENKLIIINEEYKKVNEF